MYQVAEVQKSLSDIGYDLNDLQRLVEGLVSYFNESSLILLYWWCLQWWFFCTVCCSFQPFTLKLSLLWIMIPSFAICCRLKKKRRGTFFCYLPFNIVKILSGPLVPFTCVCVLVKFFFLLELIVMLTFFVSGWEDMYVGR